MDKYDACNDYYCYPNTVVLKNKLNITNGEELENAEREITTISIHDIKYSSPPYNLKYLQNIHKTLFFELYDWAGEIRNVDISKGGTRFCTATRIVPEIEKLFKNLERESHLTHSGDNFAMKLAEYYAEFNMIHPFREGNGRVQRLFFEHLASYNNYGLDWSSITQDEWIKANIDGYYVQYQSLAEIFEKTLTKV